MSRIGPDRDSIRMRVTVLAASVALVVITIGSVLFVFGLQRSLEQSLTLTARQEIATIRAQIAGGSSLAEVVVTGGDDIVVQLVAADGRVLASDHPETETTPLLTAAGVGNDLVVPGEADLYTVVAEQEDGAQGVSLIVVGRSSSESDQARDVAGWQLLLAVPLVVALLSVTVWLSVGRALRPVEDMRREVDSITSAHLHRRLALPPGGDEIPRLAGTLNEMLDRIDESQRLQQQFVADASHELRSPLAAIRQMADVARRYPGKVAVESLADDVLIESQRLEELVSALLVLARLDDGAGDAHELVDLDDLVLEAVARVRQRAPGVPIDATRVSAGQVHGSGVLLSEAVRNLLDNASRHATSQVSVALGERDGSVELVVDDDGAGVGADERERVFERFVRLDEARAREAGGAGLGLAIVRKIVELSGGTVMIERADLGGARFVVRIPVAGQAGEHTAVGDDRR